MAKQDVIKHFRTSTPGRVPLSSEIDEGEYFINVFDAKIFIKDASGNIREIQGVQEKVFNVTSPGQKNFPVLATATKVLTFLLNQLDYSEFVSITPAGSGIIVFDEVGAEYVTEAGDYVKVLYF